ncbi:MAG: Hsp20/alpha crystallin family protein [Phaeospirillum sp.]|nr:Hsp20/alpha crystallin family protein [Phaeospirillum sp.]
MNRMMVPKGRGPLASRDAPFFALQRGINRMFDDLWHGVDMPAVFTGHRFPSLEVHDQDKEVKVSAELPGLTEKDVDLTLENGILTLKGEKKSETTETTEHGVMSERWYGRFERSVAVDGIDEDAVTASFENGILTVTLPKSERQKEAVHKIPIAAK